MCSYLMLEIKSFVSLKNESFLFWTRVHFKRGGSYVLQNFEGGWEPGKEVRSIVQGGADSLEDTMY